MKSLEPEVRKERKKPVKYSCLCAYMCIFTHTGTHNITFSPNIYDDQEMSRVGKNLPESIREKIYQRWTKYYQKA